MAAALGGGEGWGGLGREQMMAQKYPSPDEAQRIVNIRGEILQQIGSAVLDNKLEQTLARLMRKYGEKEVTATFSLMEKRIKRDQELERLSAKQQADAQYRDYVAYYHRFGGNERFVQRAEFDRLKQESDGYTERIMAGKALSAKEDKRLAEITNLLFESMDMWEDLVPENPPAKMSPIA